jgi:hypothetical protein
MGKKSTKGGVRKARPGAIDQGLGVPPNSLASAAQWGCANFMGI